MHRKYASLISLFAFIFFMTSCSMFTSKEYLARVENPKIKDKDKIWVTTTNGMEYELYQPKIKGSMIVGTVYSAEMYNKVKEIEISKIAFVKAEEIDNGKVTLVILGAVLAPLFCLAIIYGMEL